MGLFLPAEWRSLEAAARADRAMMGSVRKRYPHLNEEQQVEEAVADRFARWQGGDKERGFVAKAFERVRNVLRAVGEALRGGGFTTAESVMRALAGGEIGARPEVQPTDPMSGNEMETVAKRSIVARADDARTALTRLAGKGSPFAGKMADAIDRWRTAVQDRYLPLLRTQQRIEMQLGRPLTEAENPYLGEELLTGRVGAKLENLAENMVEPLFDTMQREGVSIEELESYLYARHAPERNARIAKINPEFKNGGGSGMSDIEAAAIINRIEKAGKTDALKRVAALVDGIRDYALQERIDGGLMSADEAKAWRETYENYVPLRGKGDAGTDGEADGKWYREFTNEGGRVYFNNVEDLAGLKGRIEKEFARAAARQSGPKMNMLTAQRGFNAVRDFVEAANSGVENAVRLAAYKNAREAGATKAQAASIAKNLTVNFNRRGQMGPAINAAYLFFNASMQGTARILSAMKSPRVRKILAGVVVGGFLTELLNAFMSGTDDDGESYYDKISDFDKSRNIILMIPGTAGEHIKIPMPYGYNVFANAGRTLAEVYRRGGDRWQESASNFVSSVADAFNPIGGTDSILKAIAPTIIDPIVDLEQNSDYSGRPIMPEQNPFEPPAPDAQRYFGSVGPHWRAITDWLTKATGGSDVEPGAIDVSPETLEHLSGVVFGAAGSFLDRNVGLVGKLATGEEVEANDFPLVRKVYGEKPGWYDKSAFFDRVSQVEQATEYAKGYIEREDWDRFDAFVGKNEQLLSLEDATKAANKQLREIRKARRENDFAREMGKVDEATWSETNDAVKAAEKDVIGQFNTVWNATMLPQSDKGAAPR